MAVAAVTAVAPVAIPIPVSRLDAGAVAWLAEAAAKADALKPRVWIELKPDRFVVRGVVGDRAAMRDVPFPDAERLPANLLLAAVLAVHRELTGAIPLRSGRPARSGRRLALRRFAGPGAHR